MKKEKGICCACGFKFDSPVIEKYYEKEVLCSIAIYCPCCWFDLSERSYNNLLEIGAARERLKFQIIRGHLNWCDKSQKPDNWDYKQQLKQIPIPSLRKQALDYFGIEEDL